MDDFEEVKARLRRTRVTSPDHDDAHGVLALDGDESVIELTGDLSLGEIPPPGWFDIRLRDSDGKGIFVHNAVRTSMTLGHGSVAPSISLFPNMVVDNDSALNAAGKCHTISFRLDGWEGCFDYNYFETLEVFGESPDWLREPLDKARYDFNRAEPFAPDRVFVANDLGTIIQFEACGRSYAVYPAMSEAFGRRNRLDVRIRLIGTITFPEPVDLDEATNACWDWRRYFNQLAMSKLPFLGMAVTATPDLSAPRGSLYLPNECISKMRDARLSNRYQMPLNRWSDRGHANSAMQAWMEREEEYRVFRASLDQVLARPGHIAIEDAVALCAGIDTLTELSVRDSLPKEVLNAMANAAVNAAADMDLSIDQTRVRGLLGSLQNDDLRRKLRRLAALAAPETSAEAVNHWIEVILPLRLFGAHGRSPTTDHALIAGPAVDALAALCARFDLQKSGVPDQCSNGAHSLPRRRWDSALFELRSER